MIGGLISGGVGLLGGGLNALYAKKQQQRQMKHDVSMANLSQKQALEQMQVQNQYQVEQWQRENEYNDPAAVRERYEAAGISPHAAFGTGSASGAGIAGGLSSAPSGHGSGTAGNIMTPAPFGGLGSAYVEGARLAAQNKKDIAEAKLKEEQALNELFDRKFIKPHTARLQSALADAGLSDAEIKKVEAQWAPYLADLKSRVIEGNLNEQLQRIEESEQRILESQSLTLLNEDRRKLVSEQIKETSEKAKQYAYERAYKKALTQLTNNQVLNTQMDTALKQAKKGHTEALKKHVEKEIEYIGKRMQLADAKIKKWNNDIALNWSKFAVSTAQATSQEVRNWIYGWIPGVKQQKTNFFGSDDVPMFAD